MLSALAFAQRLVEKLTRGIAYCAVIESAIAVWKCRCDSRRLKLRLLLVVHGLTEYRMVCKVVKIAALIFNLEYHYECFHSQSQTSIGTDR
jgi:hypothetical protein